jgi:hypothetical protein
VRPPASALPPIHRGGWGEALTPLLSAGEPWAPGTAFGGGTRVLYRSQAPRVAPLLVLEARIPDGGTFNRGDYYRTALVQ